MENDSWNSFNLFIEDSNEEIINPFKKLSLTLTYYTHNFKILHWRASGIDFQEAHDMMSEFYNRYIKYGDYIAELGMTLEPEITVPTLEDSIDFSDIKVDPNKLYQIKDCYQIALHLMSNTLSLINEVIESNILEGLSIHTLLEIKEELELECNYKLKRKIK